MVDSLIGGWAPEAADAVLVGVPYGHGASFGQGAGDGPRAVLGCLERQIEFFERHTRTEPARLYRIGHETLDDVAGLAPEAMVARVAGRVARLPGFVVLVGGVHSVTVGALRALAGRADPAGVTVVQVDAHLDMRDDDSDYNDVDPIRYAHSTVMRRAREMGFNTCSVGIRAYSADEHAFAAAEGLPVFEWGRDGGEPTVEEVLRAVGTERVYLTVDVDGFDPSVAPATGTPVPGGLSWAYGTRLIRRLFEAKEVVGADVVEVAPDGRSGLTEYAAAQLCYDIMGYRLLKRDGRLAFV